MRRLATRVIAVNRCYWKYALQVLLVFVVCYHGSNLVGPYHPSYYPLHWSWELKVPLIPVFIIPYLSVYLLATIPAFAMDCESLEALRNRMLVCIVASVVCFNLLPAKLAYAATNDLGPWEPVFRLMYLVDRPYNLFPSLHISLSWLIMASLWSNLSNPIKTLFTAWFCLIGLSVILTHQHHVLDVAGGLFIGVLLHSGWQPRARMSTNNL